MERWGRIVKVEVRSADQGGKWFVVGACAAGNIMCTAVKHFTSFLNPPCKALVLVVLCTPRTQSHACTGWHHHQNLRF